MPIFGPNECKCVSCGKVFHRISGDVLTIFDTYCTKCLIKIGAKKIKNMLRKK